MYITFPKELLVEDVGWFCAENKIKPRGLKVVEGMTCLDYELA